MARLDFKDFEDLDAVFSHLAEIPASVKKDALKAMGTIAAAQIKRSGESMGVRDPDSDVHILDTIKMNKPSTTKSGGYLDITFQGKRTRSGRQTRNAEIAFVNEYGKRKQKARPFTGAAMEQSADKIANAGAEILWDHVEQEFSK